MSILSNGRSLKIDENEISLTLGDGKIFKINVESAENAEAIQRLKELSEYCAKQAEYISEFGLQGPTVEDLIKEAYQIRNDVLEDCVDMNTVIGCNRLLHYGFDCFSLLTTEQLSILLKSFEEINQTNRDVHNIAFLTACIFDIQEELKRRNSKAK